MMFFRRRNKLVQEDVQTVIKWVIAEDVYLSKLTQQLSLLLESVIKQATSLRGVKGAVQKVGKVEIRLDDNVSDLLFKIGKLESPVFPEGKRKATDKLVTRVEVERATLLRDLSRYTGKLSQLYNQLSTQLEQQKFSEVAKTAHEIIELIKTEREQCQALIADLRGVIDEITSTKSTQRADLDKNSSGPAKMAYLITQIREICNSKDLLRKIKLQNALEMWVSVIEKYLSEPNEHAQYCIMVAMEFIGQGRFKKNVHGTPMDFPFFIENAEYVLKWKQFTKLRVDAHNETGAQHHARVGVAHFAVILEMCGLYEAAAMLFLKFIETHDLSTFDVNAAMKGLEDTFSITHFLHWAFYKGKWYEFTGDQLQSSKKVFRWHDVVHEYDLAKNFYRQDDATLDYDRCDKKSFTFVLEFSLRDASTLIKLDENYFVFRFLWNYKGKYMGLNSKQQVWKILLTTWKRVPTVHPLNLAQLYDLAGDFEHAALIYEEVYTIDDSALAARKIVIVKRLQQFNSRFSLDLIDGLPPTQQIIFILNAVSKNKNVLLPEDSVQKKLEAEGDYVKITKKLVSMVQTMDDSCFILSTYMERDIPFESVWRILAVGFERKKLYASAGHCFVHLQDWKRAARNFERVDPEYAKLLLSG